MNSVTGAPFVGLNGPMIGHFWRNPRIYLYFRAMNKHTEKGFTLLELLVTVVVMGVVLGVGVPNFLEFVRSNRMAAAANEMVSGIYAARSEAIKAQRLVTLCGSADPMAAAPVCGGGGVNGGFVVFVDDADGDGIDATDGNVVIDPGEQIVMRRAAPGGTINVTADAQFIAYAPNGFIAPPVAGVPSASTILFCDERGNQDLGGRSAARVVTISATGRPQMFNLVPDVANAIGLLGAACP